MRRHGFSGILTKRQGRAVCTLLALLTVQGMAQEPAVTSIFDAIAGETNDEVAPEISTRELQAILESGEAIVFDSRPFEEFALGHIEGAVNLAAKPGVPMSFYVSDVAEADRVLKKNKSTAIVLYCNGPFCQKSKLLAGELVAEGYKNVRRYQLGT
ncbi:MAG: rhodanese-like domain-containing protein, partial [Woeseiaceae bacterium]